MIFFLNKYSEIALFLLILIGCSSQLTIKEDPNGVDYNRLIKKLIAGDKDVDFEKLRIAYTQTSQYNPYDEKLKILKEKMYNEINNNKSKDAIKTANKILERYYLSIDAHIVCKAAYDNLGKTKMKNFHNYIGKGLLNSILSSGDGESLKSPYFIIALEEEDVVMRFLNLKIKSHELVEVDGRYFDVFKAYHPQTGEEKEVCFDIDLPYRWLWR